jgi:hypothetical protein
MRTYSKPLTILALVAALAVCTTVVAACGSSTQAEPQATAKPVIPPGQPVDEQVEVDTSLSTADQLIRHEYLAAAMRGVEAVTEAGQHLGIYAYFSKGLSHNLKLLDATVPTTNELAGIPRAEKVVPTKNAAESVLTEVLGLTKQRQPRVAQAMANLGHAREGTDVAGALASALEAAGGPEPSVVLTISDGEDLRFRGHYHESPKALAKRVMPLLPKARPHTSLVIAGVGGSTGGTPTPLTERLLATWKLICHHVEAQHCLIQPDLDLSRLFGGE